MPTCVKFTLARKIEAIGSLSSDVFERRTSSGSEPFPVLISLDATLFILPSVLILTETICPKVCSKSRLKSAKLPFPVDVRRSKTSLLKLPNVWKVADPQSHVSVKVESRSTSRLFSTIYILPILFTWLKFTCVNLHSQKRVSGNQLLNTVSKHFLLDLPPKRCGAK